MLRVLSSHVSVTATSDQSSEPPSAQNVCELRLPRLPADRGRRHRTLGSTLFVLLLTGALVAEELPLHSIRMRVDDGERQIRCRILVEVQDGGLLVQTRDGTIATVDAAVLIENTACAEAFVALSPEELGRVVCADLGNDFRTYVTRHYVICSDAGAEYAKWCGALFERLLAGFYRHWKSAGLELERPEFPLPAIVFAGQRSFAQYAARDAGPSVAATAGYYSLRTNRMALFDLASDKASHRPRSPAEISRRVAAARFNVATIMHEATHQIAFCSGMHRRYADNPMWLTEGMAMYFEVPDLKSSRGWKTIGQVNPSRLRRFQDYAKHRRGTASLLTLIRDNTRFQDTATADDAYAEAWSLTWFLVKTRRTDFIRWLKHIQHKPRLMWDDRQTRVEEFETVFGDIHKLDADLVRYLERKRR